MQLAWIFANTIVAQMPLIFQILCLWGAAIEFVNEVVIERVDEALQQGDPNSIACSMFLLVLIGNLCSCLFRFYAIA